MDDEDWLDDSGPSLQQGHQGDPLVDREWEKLSTKYNDAGYREGITDGKLSTLQEGFDAGFVLAVPFARSIGSLRGRTTALLNIAQTLSSAPGSTPDPTGSAALIDAVRALLADLGKVRRDDVLPLDLEREQHEEEDRIARGEDPNDAREGFELDPTDKRDMEGLERALEGFGTGGDKVKEVRWEGRKGDELVGWLQGRLERLEGEVMGAMALRG